MRDLLLCAKHLFVAAKVCDGPLPTVQVVSVCQRFDCARQKVKRSGPVVWRLNSVDAGWLMLQRSLFDSVPLWPYVLWPVLATSILHSIFFLNKRLKASGISPVSMYPNPIFTFLIGPWYVVVGPFDALLHLYNLYISVNSPSNWNASNIINGDASQTWPSTTLYFSNFQSFPSLPVTYDLTSNTFSHVNIFGSGDNVTFKINSATTAGVQAFNAGGANDKLVTADSTLDLSHTTVSGFSVTSANGLGTTFTVGDLGTAFQIAGGLGNDTLIAQGLTLTANQRTEIFATSSIETITDQTGTYEAPPPSPDIFGLTAGNDTVVAPSSGATVYATAATLNSGDSLTGGVGTDVLALVGSGTFRIDQLASFSGFESISVNNATNSFVSLTLGSQPIEVDVTGYSTISVNSPSNWNASNIINGDASQTWSTKA